MTVAARDGQIPGRPFVPLAPDGGQGRGRPERCISTVLPWYTVAPPAGDWDVTQARRPYAPVVFAFG